MRLAGMTGLIRAPLLLWKLSRREMLLDEGGGGGGGLVSLEGPGVLLPPVQVLLSRLENRLGVALFAPELPRVRCLPRTPDSGLGLMNGEGRERPFFPSALRVGPS